MFSADVQGRSLAKHVNHSRNRNAGLWIAQPFLPLTLCGFSWNSQFSNTAAWGMRALAAGPMDSSMRVDMCATGCDLTCGHIVLFVPAFQFLSVTAVRTECAKKAQVADVPAITDS